MQIQSARALIVLPCCNRIKSQAYLLEDEFCNCFRTSTDRNIHTSIDTWTRRGNRWIDWRTSPIVEKLWSQKITFSFAKVFRENGRQQSGTRSGFRAGGCCTILGNQKIDQWIYWLMDITNCRVRVFFLQLSCGTEVQTSFALLGRDSYGCFRFSQGAFPVVQ